MPDDIEPAVPQEVECRYDPNTDTIVLFARRAVWKEISLSDVMLPGMSAEDVVTLIGQLNELLDYRAEQGTVLVPMMGMVERVAGKFHAGSGV